VNPDHAGCPRGGSFVPVSNPGSGGGPDAVVCSGCGEARAVGDFGTTDDGDGDEGDEDSGGNSSSSSSDRG